MIKAQVTPEGIQQEVERIEYWQHRQAKEATKDMVNQLHFQVLEAIECGYCDDPQACAEAALKVNDVGILTTQ
jgi:hypothetical protein